MLAHARRPVGRQRGSAAGSVPTQAGRGGVGSQRVVDRVDARCRDGGIERTVLRIDDFEGRAVCAGDDIHRADIGIRGVNAEPDRPQAAGDACRGQQVVVRVQGQRCAVWQAGADLQLCLQYILARAEIFQMRNTDHRNDARAGPGTAGQTLDLARVVHAHLDNGVLGIVGQAEQRVGHADVIVLVALGLEGLTEGGEHRVAELLRRRLADAARDTDHSGVEQHPVVGRHADHGPAAVRHNDRAVRRHALDGMVGNDIFCAAPVGTGGVVMAVNTLAGEADKNTARLDLAAVGHNGADGDRLGQRQSGQQLIGRNGLHEKDLLYRNAAFRKSPGAPCGDAYPSSFAGSISSVTVGASLVVSSPLSIVSVMIVP